MDDAPDSNPVELPYSDVSAQDSQSQSQPPQAQPPPSTAVVPYGRNEDDGFFPDAQPPEEFYSSSEGGRRRGGSSSQRSSSTASSRTWTGRRSSGRERTPVTISPASSQLSVSTVGPARREPYHRGPPRRINNRSGVVVVSSQEEQEEERSVVRQRRNVWALPPHLRESMIHQLRMWLQEAWNSGEAAEEIRRVERHLAALSNNQRPQEDSMQLAEELGMDVDMDDDPSPQPPDNIVLGQAQAQLRAQQEIITRQQQLLTEQQNQLARHLPTTERLRAIRDLTSSLAPPPPPFQPSSVVAGGGGERQQRPPPSSSSSGGVPPLLPLPPPPAPLPPPPVRSSQSQIAAPPPPPPVAIQPPPPQPPEGVDDDEWDIEHINGIPFFVQPKVLPADTLRPDLARGHVGRQFHHALSSQHMAGHAVQARRQLFPERGAHNMRDQDSFNAQYHLFAF